MSCGASGSGSAQNATSKTPIATDGIDVAPVPAGRKNRRRWRHSDPLTHHTTAFLDCRTPNRRIKTLMTHAVRDRHRTARRPAPSWARLPSEDDAARWAAAVRSQAWNGIIDVVPAYRTVAVHANPDVIDLDHLARRLEQLAPSSTSLLPGRLIAIPVLYDGEDLPEVARCLNLPPPAVIAAHTAQEYRVFAIGFQPGFPYAGYLPKALSGLARRGSPRARVPAGSVAIVGRQTAVYPSESPGGWHLIGQTPLRIADPFRGRFPIQAGDRLRFSPIGRDEFEARREEPL